MDKERLEKCKVFANANDIDWLVSIIEEQQKKIELTKSDLQVYIAKWKAQGVMIQKLHDENARLREAIEEVLRQHENEDEIDDHEFMWNVNQILSKALEYDE